MTDYIFVYPQLCSENIFVISLHRLSSVKPLMSVSVMCCTGHMHPKFSGSLHPRHKVLITLESLQWERVPVGPPGH